MDKKGVSLKFYSPKEFSELVTSEGKGKMIGHMFIRAALQKHLDSDSTVGNWKGSPEPVLFGRADYDKMLEQSKAQTDEVVSVSRVAHAP